MEQIVANSRTPKLKWNADTSVFYKLPSVTSDILEDLSDPYNTSDKSFQQSVKVIADFNRIKIEEIRVWLNSAEIDVMGLEILTNRDFKTDEIHVGLHVSLTNKNNALLFKLKWL